MLSKIILVFAINIIICSKYPIFEKISSSKKGKKKTIDVGSSEDYMEYVKDNDNVISYFHSDWCDECQEFLPILDEASKYKIINKKWVFLKVDCAKNNHVCMNLGVDQYPTSEIYRKSELLSIDLPTDLIPLLELLYKLSTEPIIRITSKEDFFKKYGYYTPIIEVDKLKEKEIEKNKKKQEKNEKNEKNEEENDEDNEDEKEEETKEDEEDFLECIKKVANNEFIQTFYFGLIEAKDYKDKIVFDNDNHPVTYLWDGICQNAIDFLNENKYPLLSKIDKYLLKDFDDDPRTLVSLMTFPDNPKINDFINSEFKKLAYEHRNYIFGYVNYTENKDVFDYYFKVELNNTNEIKFIINNFEERSYYLRYPVFNIENQTESEIYDDMKLLLSNLSNLNFETGSKFQDFINMIGFNKMTPMKQGIVIIVLILICIGCVYFFGNPEDLDDDDYYYEEVDTTDKEKST